MIVKPKNAPEAVGSEHPLASYVPGPMEYVGRTVGGVEDMTAVAEIHRKGENLLIEGPTGSAKTTFIYAYAAKAGLPVINVPCNGGIDTRTLLGGWTPTGDGSFEFTPGELVLGVKHGAVIILNEVNFAPPKILAFLFGLLDRRRTVYLPDAAGSDFPTLVKAHPDTLIVADYNPGYEGTRPLNKAFKNRFKHKWVWGYSHEVEDTLLCSASLLEMAEKLRARIEVGDLFTPIPTNALMEFEDNAWTEVLGWDYAVWNFLNTFSPEEVPVVTEVLGLYSDRIRSELYGVEDEVEAIEAL